MKVTECLLIFIFKEQELSGTFYYYKVKRVNEIKWFFNSQSVHHSISQRLTKMCYWFDHKMKHDVNMQEYWQWRTFFKIYDFEFLREHQLLRTIPCSGPDGLYSVFIPIDISYLTLIMCSIKKYDVCH